tara:strand:- start:375 stop:758 length:384 start_codon:yes stop_codon:yes gene_type:complete
VKIHVTTHTEFTKTRIALYQHLKEKEFNLSDFSLELNNHFSLLLARAIYAIHTFQADLETNSKKQLLFKQLTQTINQTQYDQNIIIKIFKNCVQRNAFTPSENGSEFEALTSLGLGYNITSLMKENE